MTEDVTLAEAAKMLGVHETTVRVMIRDEKLRARKATVGRPVWLIRRDSIVRPAPHRPSDLDLAIDRYEVARSRAGAARSGTPEFRDAAAERDRAENALMRELKAHGKQHRRGDFSYQSDGEELYRYAEEGVPS